MTTSFDFSIIIVNYNSSAALRDLLDSWLKVATAPAASSPTAEFIIMDNGSESAEVDSLNKYVAQICQKLPITTYFLPKNFGFGPANNYAAARSQARFLLFLNPDTLLTAPILPDLAVVLADETVGGVSPRLVLRSLAPQPDSYGSFPTLIRVLTRKISPRVGSSSHASSSLVDAAAPLLPVDWVSGACLGVRRDVFAALGGFDPRFFMYFEDVDLCRRAAAAGYRQLVVTTSALIHLGGERTVLTRARRARYFSGQDQYFRRWRPLEYPLLRLLRLPYQLACHRRDLP